VVVQTGRDANGDGMLETSEVGSTQEICTAPTPTLTTVLAIAGGDVRCPIGGTAVETGLDANGNGILDPSEITTTDYECLVAPDGMDIQAFTPPYPFTGWTTQRRSVTESCDRVAQREWRS